MGKDGRVIGRALLRVTQIVTAAGKTLVCSPSVQTGLVPLGRTLDGVVRDSPLGQMLKLGGRAHCKKNVLSILTSLQSLLTMAHDILYLLLCFFLLFQTQFQDKKRLYLHFI